MENINKYIEKYGDLSFDEKDITEVDILIFSQLPYINFSNTNDGIGMRLDTAWEKNKSYNEIPKSYPHKTAIMIIEKIIKTIRYQNIIIKNYQYVLDNETQFGALTLVVNKNLHIVCFEGTDHSIAGWKEDFQLTYIYPTESQELATHYLNKAIKQNGPNIIICGHSKGGNLALVGAMNTNFLKKHKIIKIYSFDGPGLKTKEFKSINYKLIRNKLVNIIPNQSLVGILLEQENTKVIKSDNKGLLQHDTTSWCIKNDEFITTKQDSISKRLDELIQKWLEKHDYEERKKIVEGVFSIFEKANIDSTYEINENKIKSAITLIKCSTELDKETRDIILDSLKLLIFDLGSDIISDSKKNFINTIDHQIKKIKNITQKNN